MQITRLLISSTWTRPSQPQVVMYVPRSAEAACTTDTMHPDAHILVTTWGFSHPKQGAHLPAPTTARRATCVISSMAKQRNYCSRMRLTGALMHFLGYWSHSAFTVTAHNVPDVLLMSQQSTPCCVLMLRHKMPAKGKSCVEQGAALLGRWMEGHYDLAPRACGSSSLGRGCLGSFSPFIFCRGFFPECF